MAEVADSFVKYIKIEDDYEKTPAGRLWQRYTEQKPDLDFNWGNNIKYVNSFDSKESMEWAEYLLKEGNKLLGHIVSDEPCHNSLSLSPPEIKNGHHLVIANWFYNNCYFKTRVRTDVFLRNLTRFESEHRERILNKLTRCVGAFKMDEDEKESICSYYLIRRSDKFKKMFIANKLMAIQVLNRFAAYNKIRFEDAETIMREYSYVAPHKVY